MVDVYLSGTVSELASRRAEFTALLREGGAERLVAELRRRTEALLAAGDPAGGEPSRRAVEGATVPARSEGQRADSVKSTFSFSPPLGGLPVATAFT